MWAMHFFSNARLLMCHTFSIKYSHFLEYDMSEIKGSQIFLLLKFLNDCLLSFFNLELWRPKYTKCKSPSEVYLFLTETPPRIFLVITKFVVRWIKMSIKMPLPRPHTPQKTKTKIKLFPHRHKKGPIKSKRWSLPPPAVWFSYCRHCQTEPNKNF